VATYRLSSSSIGRSGARSSVASAAYRSAEKLHDSREDITHDFTKKQGVYQSEVMLPENAPEALKDRQTLWNEVEKAETRANASLAKEYQLSLPHELSHDEKVRIAREFAQEQFVDKGLGVDIAFHDFESNNPHCHIMTTTRYINEQGLDMGNKPVFFRERSYLIDLRKDWEHTVNKGLEKNGIEERVTADSYRKHGIDLKGISINGYSENAREKLAEKQQINGEKLLEKPEMIFNALTLKKATFSTDDMVKFVTWHSTPEQSKSIMDKALESKELVTLKDNVFTSKDYFRAELNLYKKAETLDKRFNHRVDMNHAAEVSSKLTLNESQQVAYAYALKNDSAIKNIVGMAGTGKSHTIKALTEVYQQSGYEVKGMALSGIVAENLAKDANISDSKTIHSFLNSYENGYTKVDKKTVLVMDEASMVGTRQMSKVLDIAEETGAKLIMVGDNQQLQAIDAGGAFRGVIDTTTSISLDEIQRQNNDLDKLASFNLATGNVQQAFQHYREKGAIIGSETKEQSLYKVKENYFKTYEQSPEKSQIVLAYKRDDVSKLNQAIRSEFKERGLLGESTEINGKEFAEGDRFVFLKNQYDMDVRNGTVGTIERIQDNELQIKTDDNRTINFNANEYKEFDHAYAMTIHKSQGVTVDQTHLHFDKNMDSHLSYVGMTRHREDLNVYVHTSPSEQNSIQKFSEMVEIGSKNNLKGLAQDFQNLAKLEQNSPGKFEQFMEKVTGWIDGKIENFVNQSALIQNLEKIDKALDSIRTEIAQEVKHEKAQEMKSQDVATKEVAQKESKGFEMSM
jgi:Ti-type conjugative transfer relaxase TraA